MDEYELAEFSAAMFGVGLAAECDLVTVELWESVGAAAVCGSAGAGCPSAPPFAVGRAVEEVVGLATAAEEEAEAAAEEEAEAAAEEEAAGLASAGAGATSNSASNILYAECFGYDDAGSSGLAGAASL